MPDINLGHVKHSFGKRRCSSSPQDTCDRNPYIDPVTGISQQILHKAGLPQTRGGSYSARKTKLNEKNKWLPRPKTINLICFFPKKKTLAI